MLAFPKMPHVGFGYKCVVALVWLQIPAAYAEDDGECRRAIKECNQNNVYRGMANDPIITKENGKFNELMCPVIQVNIKLSWRRNMIKE